MNNFGKLFALTLLTGGNAAVLAHGLMKQCSVLQISLSVGIVVFLGLLSICVAIITKK